MSERRIAFDDGASTVLESWGSGGPNVLCLHGMTNARKGWARTAGAMELAYRVHAYDMRGHGDAAAVHGPMSFARIVRDCAEICDVIPGGVDTIVGHSWGGAIAILAGLQLPVSRIVAIDPMFHEEGNDWAAYWHKAMDPTFALHGADRERAIIDDYGTYPDIEVQAKIHALQHMSIEPLLRIGRENHADQGKIDLRETIVNYPKPLLFMLADPAESVVDEKDAAFIREHGGPRVTVRVFPGEPHSLHRTSFDEYMRVLNAFVGVPA